MDDSDTQSDLSLGRDLDSDDSQPLRVVEFEDNTLDDSDGDNTTVTTEPYSDTPQEQSSDQDELSNSSIDININLFPIRNRRRDVFASSDSSSSTTRSTDGGDIIEFEMSDATDFEGGEGGPEDQDAQQEAPSTPPAPQRASPSPSDQPASDNDQSQSHRRPLSDVTSNQYSDDRHQIPDEDDQSPKAKKKKLCTSDDDDDDGMTCSVCLDTMTNSGLHRIVCLSCGHVFGKSCVERWLKSGCMNGARRCPTCNKKASIRDIRTIYVKKLRALDTVERDRIQMELEKVKREKTALEFNFTKTKLICNEQMQRIDELQKKILSLENRQVVNNNLAPKSSVKCVSLVNKVVVNESGGCRVLACSIEGNIVVSQRSHTPFFFDHGVCLIRAVDEKPVTVRLDLHNNMVRDVAFNPNASNELLTVSLDCTAKITDLKYNRTINTFSCGHQLWSCAWDASNAYQFITGSQNGIVTIYDTRNTNESFYSYSTIGDTTPVISLASIPPTDDSHLQSGGIISCRLNSVYAMHNNNKTNELIVTDGPFISLDYNKKSRCLLLSTRPSSRFPGTRHTLYELASARGKEVTTYKHLFTCGPTGRYMSRSSQTVMSDGDIWVAAHNEAEKAVQIMSVNQSRIINSTRLQETILDVSPFFKGDSTFLASLSEKSLFVHKIT